MKYRTSLFRLDGGLGITNMSSGRISTDFVSTMLMKGSSGNYLCHHRLSSRIHHPYVFGSDQTEKEHLELRCLCTSRSYTDLKNPLDHRYLTRTLASMIHSTKALSPGPIRRGSEDWTLGFALAKGLVRGLTGTRCPNPSCRFSALPN